MTTVVVRNAEGRIINIGPWDYQAEEVETGQLIETGEVDRDGDPIFVPEIVTVFNNPLPEGAYEDTAEIVTGWDGGLYEATDPLRLPPDERG